MTRFRAGDEVFGGGEGAYAELAVVKEDRLAAKPAGLTFEQAAAIPIAGTTALQGLRDHGGLQAGQRVLVNGAGGGVGTFAVQIAKSMGAHVTGVCSTGKLELVRSLGADEVIDYVADDFTRRGPFDLVLDTVSNRPLREVRRALTPNGTLISIGGGKGRLFGGLGSALWMTLVARFVKQKLGFFIARMNGDGPAGRRRAVDAGRRPDLPARRDRRGDPPRGDRPRARQGRDHRLGRPKGPRCGPFASGRASRS